MASPEDTDDKHLTIHVVHAGFNRFSMQAILDHAKPGQPCDGRIVVRPSYGPPVRIALQNYSQVLGSVSYDDVLQNAEQVCADTECECVTRNPRYRGNARTLNHTITHNFGELTDNPALLFKLNAGNNFRELPENYHPDIELRMVLEELKRAFKQFSEKYKQHPDWVHMRADAWAAECTHGAMEI